MSVCLMVVSVNWSAGFVVPGEAFFWVFFSLGVLLAVFFSRL